MKYNDNGTYKDIYVKTFDTLPVGAEVDYDGSEVPDGWTEVTNEVFPILRVKPSATFNVSSAWALFPFDNQLENTANDYFEFNQEKTHIIAKKKCTVVVAGAITITQAAGNGSAVGITVNYDTNLNSNEKLRSFFRTSLQNSQATIPATYINLNAGDYMAIPIYIDGSSGIHLHSYVNVAVVQKY